MFQEFIIKFLSEVSDSEQQKRTAYTKEVLPYVWVFWKSGYH